MKYFYQLVTVAVALSVFAPALAQKSPPIAHAPVAIKDITFKRETCPPVERVKKNPDNTWGASNGWKSTTPFFVKSLQKFAGAQWVGVTFGEVICVYITAESYDFPVELQRPSLVQSPVGGNWTADKGGYKNCEAITPDACAFQLAISVKPENVYEELELFKLKPAPKK